jgi:hypothetical protein
MDALFSLPWHQIGRHGKDLSPGGIDHFNGDDLEKPTVVHRD